MRILANIRPDRQTVMFSATFPKSVESLARMALSEPAEVQVRRREGCVLPMQRLFCFAVCRALVGR